MSERFSLQNAMSLLFALGLAFLLVVISGQFVFGNSPMLAGQSILNQAVEQTGAANIVTSVVLAYRGIDTLGEIAILFTAATAAGLVLGGRKMRVDTAQKTDAESGFILSVSADLLFPLLLLVGFYIILHGHLTPGGGFQGGVILAVAFFLPLLAKPTRRFNHFGISLIEGLSGSAFVLIGLIALFQGKSFLQPLFLPQDNMNVIGNLFSAGSLPLLYLAVGLKVGAELAGLLSRIAEYDSESEQSGSEGGVK